MAKMKKGYQMLSSSDYPAVFAAEFGVFAAVFGGFLGVFVPLKLAKDG